MSFRPLAAIVALSVSISAVGYAHAANTVNVLQFGGVNYSSTLQVGSTLNTATTLQFGAVNRASTVQVGSPATINNSVIGQGGGINAATVGQIGGFNSSFIGQIGSSNFAGASQVGLFLNGSQIIQQSP